MTCCANDIRFIPLAAEAADTGELKTLAWYKAHRPHRHPHSAGRVRRPDLVLHMVSIEPCDVPEQEVATFY